MSARRPRIVLYDHAYETLAIQYLAARLRAEGFEPAIFFDCSMDKDYLDQDFFLTALFSLRPEQAAERILEFDPDIVGFSIITTYYPALRRIMRCLKQRRPSIVILAGGPHPTLLPERTLENDDVDFVFVGEADFSLPDFMNRLGRAGVDELKALPAEAMPGVWNRLRGRTVARGYGRLLSDLDAAPFPEKEPYYARNPALRTMYTASCSRGCVFSCTYCNSNTLRRKFREQGLVYHRTRSVANVMAELRAAKERHSPRHIMFLDNLFAPKTSWLREFSAAYRAEIGLPFFCETNPNVHSEETMELLAAANCALLQFGFQSADEEVRRSVLSRRETNDKIRRLADRAKRLGMLVCIDHIANLPGEKAEHLETAVAFYRELRPYWINLGFLQYYPEADIIDIAAAGNVLARDEIARIEAGESQTSFRLVSRSNLMDAYRVLPMRLYLAFRLPVRLGFLDSLLKRKRIARLLSPLASPFIYASRILAALLEPRDFLVRHHLLRNLRVLRIVIGDKLARRG